MSRGVGILANPILPLVGVVASAILIVAEPFAAGGWVVGVSSLAWLNAALTIRTSQVGRADQRLGDRVAIVLIASMAVGMAAGGLVSMLAEVAAVPAGGLAATAMFALLSLQVRGDTLEASSRIRLAVVAGLAVAIGLAFGQLLGRL